MQKIRTITVLLAALVLNGCAFVSVDLNDLFGEQPFEQRKLEAGGPDKVLVLELTGPIGVSSAREGLHSTEGTLERLEDILALAEKDKAIKGVILKIDSPGGSVTASDLVHRRLGQYKAKHKLPVVACITQVGTSGAYMAALAADRIVALPASYVGNIGVIRMGVSVGGLLDKLGIKDETLTTGKYKDTGNPLRSMTEDERKLVSDSFLMEAYRDFLAKVKAGRPAITEADLKVAGDGRVLNARQAYELHLIDKVGYYEDALALVCELAKLENPTVVLYRRSGEAKGGFYSWP
jgi:protease-4